MSNRRNERDFRHIQNRNPNLRDICGSDDLPRFRLLKDPSLFFIGEVGVKRKNTSAFVLDGLPDGVYALSYLIDTRQEY